MESPFVMFLISVQTAFSVIVILSYTNDQTYLLLIIIIFMKVPLCFTFLSLFGSNDLLKALQLRFIFLYIYHGRHGNTIYMQINDDEHQSITSQNSQ